MDLDGLTATTHNNTRYFIKPGFEHLVDFAESKEGKKLPSSKNTEVIKLKLPFYLKLFLYNHWRHVTKSPFLKSKSVKAYTGATLFIKNGFNTPLPVLVAEKRNLLGFIKRSFFITEELNAISLNDYIDGLDENDPNLLVIADKLGHEIGRMHAAGIYHGDLTIYNIFISKNDNTFFYLDLEGYKVFNKIPIKHVLSDLRTLNNLRKKELSTKEKAVFLRNYLKEFNPFDMIDKKSFIVKLAKMSQKRWS